MVVKQSVELVDVRLKKSVFGGNEIKGKREVKEAIKLFLIGGVL